MADLKYEWLQETLAELIHHTTEARLFSVGQHLDAALQEVQRVDAGSGRRVAPIQIATMRVALHDCLATLTQLGKHRAAQEVARALQLLPETAQDCTDDPAWSLKAGQARH